MHFIMHKRMEKANVLGGTDKGETLLCILFQGKKDNALGDSW